MESETKFVMTLSGEDPWGDKLRMGSRAGRSWTATGTSFAVVAMLLLATACGNKVIEPESTSQNPVSRPAINAVLEAHDENLMAIPGVVGVHVGQLAGAQTPCLKIMVVKRTHDLERALPTSLEGYAVVLEETGIIRPLGEP
jgi:heme exporter protein D